MIARIHSRELFSGICYDGPEEGQYHTEHGRDWFYTNVMHRDGFHPSDPPPKVAGYYYRGLYRWSYPLHAWVFVWSDVETRLPKVSNK